MTPSLREALVERGVQITEPEKKTGKECAEAYEAWKAEKAATVSQHSGQDGLRFSTAGKGKKIPSSQSGTGQFSTDSLSDGHVRSAHRSPTDTPGVPFDDAKVRKITGKAKNIKNFKNGDIPIDTQDVNKMLARVRQLLGMSYKGRSNYGVYDTPKGRFAFRLTEHNAFGDNFAQDNAQQNVSVYVAINEYNVPDSQIPYKEYRITEENYKKHRDEFVSSLFNSLDSALRTGEFTQPAYTYEVTDAEIELAATDATTKAEPMGLPHIGTANLWKDFKKSYYPSKKLLDNNGKSEKRLRLLDVVDVEG